MRERGSIEVWLLALTLALGGCQTADPLSEFFPSDSGLSPVSKGTKPSVGSAKKTPKKTSTGILDATSPKPDASDTEGKSPMIGAAPSAKRFAAASGESTAGKTKTQARDRAATSPSQVALSRRPALSGDPTSGLNSAGGDLPVKAVAVVATGKSAAGKTARNRNVASAPETSARSPSLPSTDPSTGMKARGAALTIAVDDAASRPAKVGAAGGLQAAIGPARAAGSAASPTPLRLESLLGDEKAHQTWRDQYLAKRSRSIGPRGEEEARPQALSSARQATEAKPDARAPEQPAQTR